MVNLQKIFFLWIQSFEVWRIANDALPNFFTPEYIFFMAFTELL